MDGNTLALTFVAALNLLTAVLTYLARQDAKQTRADVRVLEQNTNSIKDALVETTAIASRALGKIEGRAEAKAEAEEKP